MKIIADLHIHSRYSRAVSDKMLLGEIARWARLKGIDLVGTGDFTHPLWLREITSKLEEVSEGLFRLKDVEADNGPLFILQVEIESNYSYKDRGRRIHNLVYAPTVSAAEKIGKELAKRGIKVMSDGRPKTGLTSEEMCELVWGVDEDCIIVPAHIWTPWYSLYGSKSGFDSVEDCFGKYAERIYGIETGLSSDPAMNWRIAELNGRTILSSSDAHSGPKLGREATVFKAKNTDQKLKITYADIAGAIKQDESGPLEIACTIEFYPEEGKYHYTGHRNCKVRYSPEETEVKGTTCPVCGRPLTVGVMHRVEELSARERIPDGIVKKVDTHGVEWIFDKQKKHPPYTMIVPLLEILSEVLDSGVNTQTVQNEFDKLTTQVGNEFHILLRAPLDELARTSSERLATAIKKVRAADIVISPGFDGEFGKVRIFGEEEKTDDSQEQLGIF